MSTYEPGTVAVATVRGVPNVRVMRTDNHHSIGAEWFSGDLVDDYRYHNPHHLTDVRPLVVIDPDDAGQAVQFARGYIEAHAYSATPWEKRAEESRDRIIGAVLNGFRSLAKPPKPAEPTGLGAVVEDQIGNWWIRHYNGWHHCDGHTETPQRYADLDVIRVVSEGVS